MATSTTLRNPKAAFRATTGFGASAARARPSSQPAKSESEILFQKYFKSVGPRTYAAQLKRAGNGNHFLVLTEGKRDPQTDQIRKTRLFVFSEDFVQFFRMLQETAQFIKQHPVPDDVKARRQRFWAHKAAEEKSFPNTKTDSWKSDQRSAPALSRRN